MGPFVDVPYPTPTPLSQLPATTTGVSWVIWVPVVAALVGAFLAFLFTYWRDQIAAQKQRERLALALLAEVKALLERYQEIVGSHLQQLGPSQVVQRFTGSFGQEFFTVFDGNADKLGLFAPEHVGKIVRAYVLAKAHLETLSYTTKQLEEIGRSVIVAGPGGFRAAQRLTDAVLQQATPILRRESDEVLAAANELLGILASYAPAQTRSGGSPWRLRGRWVKGSRG